MFQPRGGEAGLAFKEYTVSRETRMYIDGCWVNRWVLGAMEPTGDGSKLPLPKWPQEPLGEKQRAQKTGGVGGVGR